MAPRRRLHGLPEPYREVFSLRALGELPFAQIAELFGKSESWARRFRTPSSSGIERRDDTKSAAGIAPSGAFSMSYPVPLRPAWPWRSR